MESVSFTNQFDDLSSNWQFINSVQSDSDSDCEFDSKSDGFGSWSLLSDLSSDHESNNDVSVAVSVDVDVESNEEQEHFRDRLIETVQQLIEQPPPPPVVDDVNDEDSARSKIRGKTIVNWADYGSSEDDKYVHDVHYEEEEREIDLDDDLMPRCVRDKIGKERMRKLGKRSFTKMMKTKKVTHTNNRRGCVHGKHDLAFKYSF